MKCEKCGKEHDGNFGSGRFCSRSCANSRGPRSDVFKQKLKKVAQNKRIEKYGYDTTLRKFKLEEKHRKIELSVNSMISSGFWQYVNYDDLDFNNLYLISRTGEIVNTKTLRQLKPSVQKNGYSFFVLKQSNGNQIELVLHRILAKTFIPNPNNCPCVNHKDEDKTNNTVDNLEWCTWQYNNTYNNKHTRPYTKHND